MHLRHSRAGLRPSLSLALASLLTFSGLSSALAQTPAPSQEGDLVADNTAKASQEGAKSCVIKPSITHLLGNYTFLTQSQGSSSQAKGKEESHRYDLTVGFDGCALTATLTEVASNTKVIKPAQRKALSVPIEQPDLYSLKVTLPSKAKANKTSDTFFLVARPLPEDALSEEPPTLWGLWRRGLPGQAPQVWGTLQGVALGQKASKEIPPIEPKAACTLTQLAATPQTPGLHAVFCGAQSSDSVVLVTDSTLETWFGFVPGEGMRIQTLEPPSASELSLEEVTTSLKGDVAYVHVGVKVHHYRPGAGEKGQDLHFSFPAFMDAAIKDGEMHLQIRKTE